jgi:hypothetical protein
MRIVIPVRVKIQKIRPKDFFISGRFGKGEAGFLPARA